MSKAVLSDDSKFLATNWRAVREVVSAEVRLRREVEGFLASLATELEQQKWWDGTWIYKKWQPDQYYVTRKDWETSLGALVMVGVDGFAPENVFGDADPPFMYVWSQKKELTTNLKACVTPHPKGSIVGIGAGGWIVKQYVVQCIPEVADDYFRDVHDMFIDFVGHYIAELTKVASLVSVFAESK